MFNYVKARYQDGSIESIKIGKIIAHVIILLVIIILGFGSFGTVPSGFRGIKTRFSKVVNVVDPGLYFKLPVIEHVTQMDIRTQTLTFDNKQATGGDSEYTSLAAASQDLQDVAIATVVNYHLDPTKVDTIFMQYGNSASYSLNIVEPIVRDTVKTIASTYTAEELVTKRSDFNDKILASLKDRLSVKYISVERINITNFEFSKSFTEAIEAKVTAVQNAEAAKNKLVQIQVEAQQAVAKAEGEAKAIAVKGAALKDNPGIVELNWIDKWNGITPTYWGSASPFIGLTK
jgi:regulator of protease activity HflC (stomatin/prohibitin superfamily)